MSNPALVEVVRSGFTESVHRGALVVTAPDGTALLSHGDVQRPVFVRSANKPLQAFGMLRAGLLIDDDELALACASHSGEPDHRRLALAMLARHGLHESALRCPPDYPAHEPSKEHVLRAGGVRRPAAMNCSGKHAAMLATCAGRGWSTFDYLDPAHELQRGIASTVAELAGESIAATGVDGCGAPLFAYSLTGLARAFGRLTSATSGPGRRIADAMRARAWLVGGTGRDDTLLMLAVDGLLTKAGAEGVHACALPDGTALALKIDDGAARARAPLLVAALYALDAVPERPAASAVLTGLAQGRQQVVGAGLPVGRLRVADDLFGRVQRRVRPVG